MFSAYNDIIKNENKEILEFDINEKESLGVLLSATSSRLQKKTALKILDRLIQKQKESLLLEIGTQTDFQADVMGTDD